MEPVSRHIERAPKDLLRHSSKFLDFPEIVRCREVCKIWKEVIDDPQHDIDLFGRFTAGDKIGTDRPCFEAAKAAYLTEIAAKKPQPSYQMNYEPPPAPVLKKKCCNSENVLIVALAILGCCTCCCCCCCCGTGSGLFPH